MNKNTKLKGRNIYVNKKGQTIYYNWLTKKGYIITSKEENRFYTFQHRFILIILFMILCTDYIFTWQQSTLLGIVLCIFLEIMFHVTFLSKLRTVKTLDTSTKHSLLEGILHEKSQKKIILKGVLYTAFSILIMINAYIQQATIAIYVLSFTIGLLSLYYAVLHFIGIKKIANRNN